MTTKRFTYYKCEILDDGKHFAYAYSEYNAEDICEKLNEQHEDLKHELKVSKALRDVVRELEKENEQLKSQLYCDDEEGVCNICKHHYLVKDDEVELAYYTSRCKKGHYECARVSLKHCEDFEKE